MTATPLPTPNQLQAVVFAPNDAAPRGYLYIIQRGVALYNGHVLTKGKVWGADIILQTVSLRLKASAYAMNYLETYYTSREDLIELGKRPPDDSRMIREQAIWLALTTPQPRVNRDLDSVVAWASSQEGADASKLAILGFCYGGGKALRYTTSSSLRGKAATVVFYGNPLTDAAQFANLEAPVCGVFGRNDVQIPSVTVDAFRDALAQAGVANEVVSYDGVGHAFWSDVAQVRRRQMPQLAAWEQTTNFLREFYTSS